MIIDSHTHVAKFGNKIYPAKKLLSSMDEAGINYSLLIAVGQTTTDQVIKICENNPRLRAIGYLPYSSLDNRQINKIVKYLKEGKIYGVKLYPGYENFYPMDEKLFPLYAQCQKISQPVIFHTGVLMAGLAGILKQVHPLHIDEVANKFPDLKIVMAHFGNPWIVDTAAVILRNKNVYIDLSGYFAEFLHLSPRDISFFVKDLTYFKNFVGSFKNCLFGTDWPLYSQKEYLEAALQLPLTDEEKDLVFWKNTKEIFGLEV
ncbi:amidohydrolase [Candidatus Microgenomates bacterium]|nr:amidohydrolase [Candidatus Microgenomates bacterium]